MISVDSLGRCVECGQRVETTGGCLSCNRAVQISELVTVITGQTVPLSDIQRLARTTVEDSRAILKALE